MYALWFDSSIICESCKYLWNKWKMAFVIYPKLYPVQNSAVDLPLMKSLLRSVGSLSVFALIIGSEELLLIKVVRREKYFVCYSQKRLSRTCLEMWSWILLLEYSC